MTHDSLRDLIGSVAGVCTTTSYFPQLLHVWRRKSAKDVSFRMFSIMCIGVAFWIVNGCMYHSWPMVLANSLALLQSLIILALKIRYDGIEAARDAGGATGEGKSTP
jgi:MtN3 and saliva related transmembrane protein